MDLHNYGPYEGFETYGYNAYLESLPDTIVLNKLAIVKMETDLSNNLYPKLEKSYTDLSNNITQYYTKRDEMINNNTLYDYSGNTFFYQNKEKKTEDVILDDTNQLLLQQNTMYTVGSIAAVSLLIVALMTGSAKE